MPSSLHRRAVRCRIRSLRMESLESRQLLAADWRNPVDALDVNNNRHVTAFDAVAIVNELNRNGAHPLAASRPVESPFLDVNNSRNVTAFDAILVINQRKPFLSPTMPCATFMFSKCGAINVSDDRRSNQLHAWLGQLGTGKNGVSPI